MERCFMFGHREADEGIYPLIVEAAERCAAKYGVGEFIVGHYGGFDRQAKRAVTEIKSRFPVKLTLLLPFHPTSGEDFSEFDDTLYPFDGYVPPKAAIIRANRLMIDLCAYSVAYARHPGFSRDLLDYAQKHGKTVLII